MQALRRLPTVGPLRGRLYRLICCLFRAAQRPYFLSVSNASRFAAYLLHRRRCLHGTNTANEIHA